MIISVIDPTQKQPITPPFDLRSKWFNEAPKTDLYDYIIEQASQWGADTELERCCEEMKSLPSPLGIPFGEMASNALRAARRPKPPSLKEQALKALHSASFQPGTDFRQIDPVRSAAIRRALEALPDD
jgi:hypothetical protein